MDLFPDGGFVRLQSRANGKYVHADGDWETVTLRPSGAAPSLNSVWRVEHWVPNQQGPVFVLLQNAAYGRYLSFSPWPAPRGHRGRRVVQGDVSAGPNILEAFVWRWSVQRADLDQDYIRLQISVRLRYGYFDLRANGRHRRWNTRVTADVNRAGGARLSTMMQWTVHAVAAGPVPLHLPLVAPSQQPLGGLRGLLLWRRTGVGQPPPRTIRHVRASDEGDFDQNHYNWPSFDYYEQSLDDLRIQLGQLQNDWNGDVLGFTLCMRPGSRGRLMPLVTDLPRSLDPINIIVLRTGSPAAAAFVYPQIAAPAQ